MIYLIEDKTSRRIKSGWSDNKIAEYKDSLTILDSYEKLADCRDDILLNNGVILYHESFVNSVSDKVGVKDFIREAENKGNMIAYFSGSKSQRTLHNNVCNLPPDVLYHNLECFIRKFQKGDADFNYLMFGEKSELEKRLDDAINTVNIENTTKEKSKTAKKLFFFIASNYGLIVPFESCNRTNNIKENGDFDFYCDDVSLCKVISDNLENEKYDGIYIPLCFGETLSDFMGLRMAMLIRFSCVRNRMSPIVIYGEASYDDMLSNECFDILKMSGVYYVDSAYKSLVDIASMLSDISTTDYINGLENIRLKVPSDIGDNHDIANRWAIHRWAKALDVSDSDIDKNDENVLSNLYFLYVSALHSVEKTKPITDNALAIKKSENQPQLKVLYIDDQADDGWYELLCSILYDRNNISLNYIGEKLKTMNQLQIMNCVEQEIETYNPNVVILDLRLHQSDFGNVSIENVTGYKIFEKIKKKNRGIQVLVFSATNKVWNLQQLIKAEADGFIVKENPTDSFDSTFTRKTIKHFVSSLNKCASQTYRVKIWQCMQEDMQILKNQSRSHKIGKEYAAAISTLLKMAEDSMFAVGMKYSYASIFMHLFRIIETIAKQYIDGEPQFDEKGGVYYFQFRSGNAEILDFDDSNQTSSHHRFEFKSEKKSLSNKQKIYNLLYYYHIDSNCYNINELVNKRNSFIHPDMIEKSELASFTVENVIDIFDIVDKLIKNVETSKS